MPNDEKFTLDHPLVQESKGGFEEGSKRPNFKCRLGFDELFNNFNNLGNERGSLVTIKGIADQAGVTHQRILQIYNLHFRRFFGDVNPRKLKREHVLAAQAVSTQTAWEDVRVLRIIGQQAKAQGYKVEVVLNPGSGYVRKSALRINGKLCSVHVVDKARAPPGSRVQYALLRTLQSSLDKYHALICLVQVPNFPERTFVVPTALIKSSFKGSSRQCVYLPLERTPVYKNRPPKIDYWQYEEAWHVLE